MIEYIASTNMPLATLKIHETIKKSNLAPIVASFSFSSRGPSYEFGGILKPDVMASGSNVLAAWVPK